MSVRWAPVACARANSEPLRPWVVRPDLGEGQAFDDEVAGAMHEADHPLGPHRDVDEGGEAMNCT